MIRWAQMFGKLPEWVGLQACVASDLFMPTEFRLKQYGLSDHNAVKHRWYYFLKTQMDVVLLFKQFDSDTMLPGRKTFHTAFVGPTARPNAGERGEHRVPRLSVLP